MKKMKQVCISKMSGSKICLFFVYLLICKAEAEKDETQDIAAVSATSLPVVLQLSKSKQFNEHEIPPSAYERNQVDKTDVDSDVEVFKENDGPPKENQEDEEEPAEGEEIPPDNEEPKSEETEAVADPDPVAEDGGAEPPPPTDDETDPAAEVETATEPVNNEEAAAEAENEEAAATEEEKESTPPTDVASADGGGAVANDEAEMPNDEPAKGEENPKPDMNIADMDKKFFSCFTCVSNEDLNCSKKATKEIKCPQANEGDKGKHNGCYTLYQADTNITMRGCVDDLAEGGLKYCLTNNGKLCNVCYSNSCNNKVAPSQATKLQLNNYTLAILNISSLILIKCAILTFYRF